MQHEDSLVFRHRYRIPSARLSGRNYAMPGSYFVTICTKNRIPWFGTIHHQTMHLSDMGRISHECWNDIPIHFPYVRLDRFVIMPDHVHGIIVIGEKPKTNIGIRICETNGSDMVKRIPRPSPRIVGIDYQSI